MVSHPLFRRVPGRRAALPLVLALLGVGGCAKPVPVGDAAKEGSETRPARPVPAFASVTIENRGPTDVVVTLVHEGQSTRLGTATASTSTTLRFPGQFIAASTPLQLVARPVGGRGEYRSERFTMQPDQTVTLTVEATLRRSFLSVY